MASVFPAPATGVPASPTLPAARLWPSAARLSDAIENGAVRTVFQPQVSLADGRLVGVEALARWNDGGLGAVPPETFVGLAEQSGLIGRLSRAVLREALGAAVRLRQEHAAARVAVNVSPLQLGNPGLPDELSAELEAAGLEPEALVVEVTETLPVADPVRAAAVVGELRLRGIGCAIDDFGAGHANLLALMRLPFSELKLDRALVARAAATAQGWKVLRAALGLARELELEVVAEGIESAEVATRLREEGCAVGQGFLFGPPMDEATLRGRFARGQGEAEMVRSQAQGQEESLLFL